MHNSSPGRQIGGASVKRLALAEESQRPDVSVEDVHDVDAEGELEECFEDYEIYDRWGGCSYWSPALTSRSALTNRCALTANPSARDWVGLAQRTPGRVPQTTHADTSRRRAVAARTPSHPGARQEGLGSCSGSASAYRCDVHAHAFGTSLPRPNSRVRSWADRGSQKHEIWLDLEMAGVNPPSVSQRDAKLLSEPEGALAQVPTEGRGERGVAAAASPLLPLPHVHLAPPPDVLLASQHSQELQHEKLLHKIARMLMELAKLSSSWVADAVHASPNHPAPRPADVLPRRLEQSTQNGHEHLKWRVNPASAEHMPVGGTDHVHAHGQSASPIGGEDNRTEHKQPTSHRRPLTDGERKREIERLRTLRRQRLAGSPLSVRQNSPSRMSASERKASSLRLSAYSSRPVRGRVYG